MIRKVQLSSRTIAGVLTFTALLGFANGRALLQTDDATCTSKPPNGTWVLEHFTPTVPDDPALIRHARSVLFVTEVEENFYIGDGSGVYFLSSIQDIYNGTQWEYHIAAFFDQESCMFSGTVFNLREEPVFPDALLYFYDGEMLRGRFVFSAENAEDPAQRNIFPQSGAHNATYLGNP